MQLKHQYANLQAMQAVAHSVIPNVVSAWLSGSVSRLSMRLQEYDNGAVVQDICPALVWQHWCPRHCSLSRQEDVD